MTNNKADFFEKDNNYQDENTIYWFHVSGEFNGQYGVCDHNGDLSIVDSECYPVELDSYTSNYLLDLLVITDEIKES